MERNNILTADILDILFEGRNKEYGAYNLRKTYNNRVRIAIGGTVIACLLMVVGSIMANSAKTDKNELVVQDVNLENIQQEEKKPEPPVPPPPPKTEPPKVEMAKFTPPKIVEDQEVKEDDEIKEIDKMADTKIGIVNQEGVKDDNIVAPPVEEHGTGVAAPIVKKPDYDEVVTLVQIPAEYEGGPDAWKKFLERNLNRDLPVENGAPPGLYQVVLSFIVNREGKISELQALTDPGYGTKEEAIRVINKATKWSPAIQNGRKVVYRHKQTISFLVNSD